MTDLIPLDRLLPKARQRAKLWRTVGVLDREQIADTVEDLIRHIELLLAPFTIPDPEPEVPEAYAEGEEGDTGPWPGEGETAPRRSRRRG